jgi:NAD(P)-dependent dehydrogenase (short-subunit alcohol dehydrogenase family)
MGRLDDKVAIVTGAAKGIGLGIAKVFAMEGASVALFGAHETVMTVAEELRSGGATALAFTLDVSDYGAVKQATDAVAAEFGRIDILVNNAGVVRLVPFLEMSDEDRDLQFDVNIKGTWNCSKAAIPHMVRNHYGRVVNLSAVTGTVVADPGESALCVTKAGIWGLTKALAIEFVGDKINVNMICPGYILTPTVQGMAESISPGDAQSVIDQISASIPMGRLGRPEDVGRLAAFLASDDAEYITGTAVVIDGGSTLPETGGAIE